MKMFNLIGIGERAGKRRAGYIQCVGTAGMGTAGSYRRIWTRQNHFEIIFCKKKRR